MLRQIIVRAVRNPPELAPAEGEEEFNVRGCLGIEGQLRRIVIPQAHLLFPDAQSHQPVAAEAPPILEPLEILARLTEKFQLHLLEFPCAECEIARRNLISKGLPDLGDSKGNLLPGRPLHILKVDENALRRLGP